MGSGAQGLLGFSDCFSEIKRFKLRPEGPYIWSVSVMQLAGGGEGRSVPSWGDGVFFMQPQIGLLHPLCLHPEQRLLYGSGRCSVIIYQNESEHGPSSDGSSEGLEGGEKWTLRGHPLRGELALLP